MPHQSLFPPFLPEIERPQRQKPRLPAVGCHTLRDTTVSRPPTGELQTCWFGCDELHLEIRRSESTDEPRHRYPSARQGQSLGLPPQRSSSSVCEFESCRVEISQLVNNTDVNIEQVSGRLCPLEVGSLDRRRARGFRGPRGGKRLVGGKLQGRANNDRPYDCRTLRTKLTQMVAQMKWRNVVVGIINGHRTPKGPPPPATSRGKRSQLPRSSSPPRPPWCLEVQSPMHTWTSIPTQCSQRI